MIGTYKVLKASDIRQHWSAVVNEVSREHIRVIGEKNGVPLVGVVGAQDLVWLQEWGWRAPVSNGAIPAGITASHAGSPLGSFVGASVSASIPAVAAVFASFLY